jgi:hypothetical protein
MRTSSGPPKTSILDWSGGRLSPGLFFQALPFFTRKSPRFDTSEVSTGRCEQPHLQAFQRREATRLIEIHADDVWGASYATDLLRC